MPQTDVVLKCMAHARAWGLLGSAQSPHLWKRLLYELNLQIASHGVYAVAEAGRIVIYPIPLVGEA